MAQMVKNQPAMQETQVQSWVRKVPWRREWQSTPVVLPGKFQRSLASIVLNERHQVQKATYYLIPFI